MSRITKYIIDGEVVSHDELRISNFPKLREFLLYIAQTPNELDEDVYGFLHNHKHFQFSGDGDGLGFIIDVWDNPELDGEPINSIQIWLDEYKQFM